MNQENTLDAEIHKIFAKQALAYHRAQPNSVKANRIIRDATTELKALTQKAEVRGRIDELQKTWVDDELGICVKVGSGLSAGNMTKQDRLKQLKSQSEREL